MITVQVTGGEVTLRERADLRIIDRQRLQMAMVDIAPQFADLPTTADGALDVEAAFEAGKLKGADLAQMFELTKAAITARLVSWTLPGPIPKTSDDLDNLNALVWDELAEHVSDGLTGLLADISVDPVNPHGSDFATSPTQPLSA